MSGPNLPERELEAGRRDVAKYWLLLTDSDLDTSIKPPIN